MNASKVEEGNEFKGLIEDLQKKFPSPHSPDSLVIRHVQEFTGNPAYMVGFNFGKQMVEVYKAKVRK